LLGELRHPGRALTALALLGVIGFGAYSVGCILWAQRHFRAAERALERNDFGEARTHLQWCLQAEPTSPEVHFLLARTARRDGNLAEAAEQLAECERLGGVPEAIEIEWLLQRVQRGDLAGKENYLWACVHKDHPDAVVILEALAQGYLQTFRLSGALKALDLLLERQPDNVRALLWRGNARDHVKSLQGALSDYRRAVQLAPDNRTARLALADSLIQATQPRDSLVEYERLRQREPDSTVVLLGLARCRLSMGEPEEARAVLDVVLGREPRHAEALVLRGKLELDLRQPARAEPWLRQAALLAPFEREAVYNLVQCLAQLRKGAWLLPSTGAGVVGGLAPLRGAAPWPGVSALLSAGASWDAAKWTAQLKRIDADQKRLAGLVEKLLRTPEDANLRCQAGEIFLAIGNDKEGVRWLQSALREDPRHEPTHRLLAHYYERTGRPDLAALHGRALMH
jgi:Tfp pilus assembly protein PilF